MFSGLGDDSDQSDGEAKSKVNRKQRNKKNKDMENKNPLITDLDYRDKEQKRAHKAELWFERDAFKNLIDEKDEDADLDKMIQEYKEKSAKSISKQVAGKSKENEAEMSSDSDYSSDEVSDYDVEEERVKSKKVEKENGFEVVKTQQSKLKKL